ncbi:tetratricopeptide repeat protein [Streptomyces sp. NPDC021224]|uniref:tetratricopeptide repeat protein n=1 Tax=unclassified Streptomyces TaxID=2593676 RepID=UPI0037AB8D86
MRRRWAGAGAAGAAVVAVALGPVTERAGAVLPHWAGSSWVVWPAFVALAALAGVLGAAPAPRPEPHAAPAGGWPPALISLRPPHLDVGRVRGREGELVRLASLLRRPGSRFAVLSAAGGTGKTTVAAALAAQAAADGYAVFWIRWRTTETLADQMVRAALACGLPHTALSAAQAGHDSLPDTVWRQFAATRRWLLVIDNADEPALIGPESEQVADYRGWIRPDGRGLLLVTSRDGSTETWGPAADIIRLAPLDDTAGGRLLRDAAPGAGNAADAEALAARLGGLPLALRAAGTGLAAPTARLRTFHAYRAALESELPALLGAEETAEGEPNPDAARQVLRHTWELSLDHLAHEGLPLARPLLRALAHFAEAPVPLDLVTPELLTTALPAPAPPVTLPTVDQTLAGLERHGLLEPAPGTGLDPYDGPAPDNSPPPAVVLHPLIREVTALAAARTGTPPGTAGYLRAVVRALTAAVSRASTAGAPGWPTARLLAPHLPLLLGAPAPVPLTEACALIDRLADVLGDSGDYALQLDLRRTVLARRRDALGEDHPDTLTSRNHEANSLYSLGNHARAAALHEQTLADRTRTLGADHPDTLISRSNFGFLLQHLGEFARAAALHQSALADRTRVLGPEHPQTLTSRSNLARSIAGLGDHATAAALHRQLAADRARVLGPDHQRTLDSRADIAKAVAASGDARTALGLHEAVLADRARVLGPRHPDTLASRAAVAATLHALGDHQRAADLHEQILTEREHVLGPDHPDTQLTRQARDRCRTEAARPTPG